jgi:phosphomannomutase
MLGAALMAGLCSVGADVIQLGVVPTPAVAYLVGKYKADAGVMISASHNPAEFNGIKIFSGNGFKLPDIIEEKLDAFVCEMAHFDPHQVRPYLARCKAKKVFFTHVFPLSKYDDIEALRGEFAFEIFSPYDGDMFEI